MTTGSQRNMPMDYTKKDLIKREYDELHNIIHYFGLDHTSDPSIDLIDLAYLDILNGIEWYRSLLTINNMDKLLDGADELDKIATRYKDELYSRADDIEAEFERKYDKLYSFVQLLRDLCMLSIDYEYLYIIDEIELVRSSLTNYGGKHKLLDKLDKLENMADEYRFEVYRKVDEEILLPTLSVVNSSDTIICADMKDSEGTHLETHQDTRTRKEILLPTLSVVDFSDTIICADMKDSEGTQLETHQDTRTREEILLPTLSVVNCSDTIICADMKDSEGTHLETHQDKDTIPQPTTSLPPSINQEDFIAELNTNVPISAIINSHIDLNPPCSSYNVFIDAGTDVCHDDHNHSEKEPITDNTLVHTDSSIHKGFIPFAKLRQTVENYTGAQVQSWDKKGIGGENKTFTSDKGKFSYLSCLAGKAKNDLYLNSSDYFDSIKRVEDTKETVKLYE